MSELNFKAIVDGLGNVLFQYPFRQVHANRAVNWSLGRLTVHTSYRPCRG